MVRACYDTHMNIEWNKVTWYSKFIAMILFVGVFYLGYWLGVQKAQKIYVIVPHLISHTSASASTTKL